MSTYGTMRSRIASEMKRGDISASATCVGRAIMSSIAFWEHKRFDFNEFSGQDFTASASTTYVPFSQIGINVLKVDTLKAIIGSRDYPLIARSFRQMNDVDAGQWFGYPDYYALRGSDLRLYPPPNDDFAMRMSGIQQLTDVSLNASNAATNSWMVEAEEMIRLKAKANLWRDELRSMETALQFEAEAGRSWKISPFRRATNRTSTGRIRPRW